MEASGRPILRTTALVLALSSAGTLLFGVPTQGPATAPGTGDEQFVPLFNGKDLKGWEGDRNLWLVEDGTIVGRSPGIPNNEFLKTTKSYRDFELRLSFHLLKGIGNSGVQFRSKLIPGHVSGYQADIGETYWGCLYDEARRNKILAQAPAALGSVLKLDGWNDYVIRAVGNHVQLWVNGLQTVNYRETDTSIEQNGIIALQIHSGAPMEVRFKNVRIMALNNRPSR